MKKRRNIPTALLAIAVALLAVLLVGVLAMLGNRDQSGAQIVLPENGEPAQTEAPSDAYLAITRENAAKAAATLSRPERYHQSLTAALYSGEKASAQTIEIWAEGAVRRVSVLESGRTRILLTDGETAFLWYADERSAGEPFDLPDEVTTDELSGIPTYESVVGLPSESIVEAAYSQQGEGGQWPCLYIRAKDGGVTDYYLDLENGLLRSARLYDEDRVYYALDQTGVELPEQGDPAFREAFRLPDGSEPFSTASEERRIE